MVLDQFIKVDDIITRHKKIPLAFKKKYAAEVRERIMQDYKARLESGKVE
jgi:hypothetical protein